MYEISKNKCIGCGTCAKVCPQGVEVINGVAKIKDANAECLKIAAIACPQKAIRDIKQELIFAIGTDDGKIIKQDDHVGMSKYYSIWKYSNGEMKFIERRENVKHNEDESRIHGDPNKAKAVSSVLRGVNVIVGKMIGPNIVRVKTNFVPVIIREPLVKKAVGIIKDNIIEIVDEYNKKERVGIILN